MDARPRLLSNTLIRKGLAAMGAGAALLRMAGSESLNVRVRNDLCANYLSSRYIVPSRRGVPKQLSLRI